MPTNSQKKIVFEGRGDKDENRIIMEILKNNGLEETADDFFKKARGGQEPWFKSLYKLSKVLASGDITEENFISSVQSQLQISQQSAKNILKEIKEKLLPLARMLNKDELEEEPASNILARPLGQPMNVFETTEKNAPKLEEKPANTTITLPKEPKIKKPILSIAEEPAPRPKRTKGPDVYREPIE